MNKIHYIIHAILAVAIIALFAITLKPSAKKASPQQNNSANEKELLLPIAFVRMDSLLSGYQYYRDVEAELTKEADKNRQTLASKVNAMQKAADDFQRRLRINAFTSEDAARAEQEKIMKMQEEGQRLELNMTQSLGKKQLEANEKIMERIKAQILLFNKKAKYQYILSNVGLDNLLYGEEAYDITDELIKQLNDDYSQNGR